MTLGYIHWDLNPEIFNLLGLSVRYYGILFVSGLLLCVAILKWIFDREEIPSEHLDKLTIYGIVGIFAGARLGHCLFYEPSYYFSHPLEIVLPIQSTLDGGYKLSGFQGLASHGGTLGLIVALIIYAKTTKESLVKTIDLIAIVAPLGAAFIRLANLANSEIVGIPTAAPWAFVFTRIDNIPRHPAQLYEAIAYLLIFALLLFLYKRYGKLIRSGFLFGLVILLIFTARFFVEFIKERQVPFEEQMQLDMGQLLSIPFIILGIIFLLVGIVKMKPPLRE